MLAREARQLLRAPVDAQDLAVGRRHDAVQCVRARTGRLEVERGQGLLVVPGHRQGGRAGEAREQRERSRAYHLAARSDLEPSFM